MPPAKPALKRDSDAPRNIQAVPASSSAQSSPTQGFIFNQVKPALRSIAGAQAAEPRRHGFQFQPRVPVITGEASYRGFFPVDGLIFGQIGANGGALSVRQRPRTSQSEPELNGELTFKEMLRVNGHIAGKVISQKGTLIVAAEARLDGDIEVGVAIISGTVKGDVVAHQRIELGPGATINGNISTSSLSMKPGAVFHGDCRVLANGNGSK